MTCTPQAPNPPFCWWFMRIVQFVSDKAWFWSYSAVFFFFVFFFVLTEVNCVVCSMKSKARTAKTGDGCAELDGSLDWFWCILVSFVMCRRLQAEFISDSPRGRRSFTWTRLATFSSLSVQSQKSYTLYLVKPPPCSADPIESHIVETFRNDVARSL